MSNCPEAVAYQLMKDIFSAEGAAAAQPPGRAAILDTYAECLKIVRSEVVKAGPTHGRSSF